MSAGALVTAAKAAALLTKPYGDHTMDEIKKQKFSDRPLKNAQNAWKAGVEHADTQKFLGATLEAFQTQAPDYKLWFVNTAKFAVTQPRKIQLSQIEPLLPANVADALMPIVDELLRQVVDSYYVTHFTWKGKRLYVPFKKDSQIFNTEDGATQQAARGPQMKKAFTSTLVDPLVVTAFLAAGGSRGLWISSAELATFTKTSRMYVNRALGVLVEHGLLLLMGSIPRPRSDPASWPGARPVDQDANQALQQFLWKQAPVLDLQTDLEKAYDANAARDDQTIRCSCRSKPCECRRTNAQVRKLPKRLKKTIDDTMATASSSSSKSYSSRPKASHHERFYRLDGLEFSTRVLQLSGFDAKHGICEFTNAITRRAYNVQVSLADVFQQLRAADAKTAATTVRSRPVNPVKAKRFAWHRTKAEIFADTYFLMELRARQQLSAAEFEEWCDEYDNRLRHHTTDSKEFPRSAACRLGYLRYRYLRIVANTADELRGVMLYSSEAEMAAYQTAVTEQRTATATSASSSSSVSSSASQPSQEDQLLLQQLAFFWQGVTDETKVETIANTMIEHIPLLAPCPPIESLARVAISTSEDDKDYQWSDSIG